MTAQQSPPTVPFGAARRDQRWRVAGLCLILAAITFGVFGQTLHHEFIDYDDNDYVYDNPVVVRGLTFKGIAWAFTQAHAANWHPLTWLSHMLDCQLYGLNPAGHHLSNVLLHIAAVIALFLVLRQMTGALWRSAFVAAVFAVHPLRVESVAWVAERKDVLSGLFFMLTVGAYVRYARRRWSAARYGLVMLLFAMGLMCKPMLVTLPVVVLLLDYWPLQRVEPVRRLVMEKLPLLALSAGSCAATFLAQHEGIQSSGSYAPPMRLANALVACVVYLRQLVWPAGLAPFYPYPLKGLPAWEVALAAMALAGLSAVALEQRRRRPWILTGWLWYLVMLLPVVGIIQVGDQAHADRYTYLPQIGIYVALTWLAAECAAKWRPGRAASAGLMAGVVAVLAVFAWKQTAYWKNGETLWTHALNCNPRNDVAHFNLANALRREGRMDEAICHLQNAVQIRPNYAQAHNNLGKALLLKGKVDEAIHHFQAALQIKPADVAAHYNLGKLLLQNGRLDEAIPHLQNVVRVNPAYADAGVDLGEALFKKGRVDEAIIQYQAALQINPSCAQGHFNLAIALVQMGRVDEALSHLQSGLQLDHDNAEAHNNLGSVLAQRGRMDEAIAHFQKAVQIDPAYAKAHNNLGNALLQMENRGEAIAHFQKALQLQPTDPSAPNNLAWLLATCPDASLRNGSKAVELARQANALSGGENPLFLHTLAAALAEAGRFSEAVETAQRALRLAGAQPNPRLAAALQSEMKLYQTGNPFHVPEQTH